MRYRNDATGAIFEVRIPAGCSEVREPEGHWVHFDDGGSHRCVYVNPHDCPLKTLYLCYCTNDRHEGVPASSIQESQATIENQRAELKRLNEINVSLASRVKARDIEISQMRLIAGQLTAELLAAKEAQPKGYWTAPTWVSNSAGAGFR